MSRCLASKVSRYPRWQDAVAAHNKTWAAAAKAKSLVAASQSCTPVDVAQPVSTTSILCGHLRDIKLIARSHCHCTRCCAGAAPKATAHPMQQRRRCSVVAAACSVAGAQSATDHSADGTGWCHESVDIATAQGAVQQLRATVPHRSSVAAAASVAVAASPVHKAQWTTGLHSWHKLTGVRIHCHCTRCCAAPEGYLSTAMFAASTGVQLSCNLS